MFAGTGYQPQLSIDNSEGTNAVWYQEYPSYIGMEGFEAGIPPQYLGDLSMGLDGFGALNTGGSLARGKGMMAPHTGAHVHRAKHNTTALAERGYNIARHMISKY